MKMPVASAINVPALRTPPENDTALSATRIAASPDAETVPALLMPPVKVEPDTTMPDVAEVILLAASIVMPWVEPSRLPLSMMAPVIVLAAMTIALGAETVPALEMLPVNALTPST